MFDAVLARSDERRAAFAGWMLAGATAREVAERVLVGSVDWLTDPSEPLACLLVRAAAGSAGPDLPRELADRRGRLLLVLTRRFERARIEGDLPGDGSAEELANDVGTVFSGLAVQAAAGGDPEDLRRVAVQALHGRPASPKPEFLGKGCEVVLSTRERRVRVAVRPADLRRVHAKADDRFRGP